MFHTKIILAIITKANETLNYFPSWKYCNAYKREPMKNYQRGLECQSGANCDWMNGNNYEKGCPWKSHVIWQPEWKSEWKSEREVAKFHPSWNNHTTSCTMHENKFTSGQHFKDDIQNTLVSRLGEENNCISIRRWLESFFLFLFFLSRLCISFLQE